MPLSPRFNELINELELKDALWHLQRANTGTDKATEEELIEGYSQILWLVQNTQCSTANILKITEKQLASIPSRESLLRDRDMHMRDSWARKGNTVDYQKTIHNLAEHVRLSRLKKATEKLRDGKGIQIENIIASIHLLPDEIDKTNILEILKLGQTENEVPSRAEAA